MFTNNSRDSAKMNKHSKEHVNSKKRKGYPVENMENTSTNEKQINQVDTKHKDKSRRMESDVTNGSDGKGKEQRNKDFQRGRKRVTAKGGKDDTKMAADQKGRKWKEEGEVKVGKDEKVKVNGEKLVTDGQGQRDRKSKYQKKQKGQEVGGEVNNGEGKANEGEGMMERVKRDVGKETEVMGNGEVNSFDLEERYSKEQDGKKGEGVGGTIDGLEGVESVPEEKYRKKEKGRNEKRNRKVLVDELVANDEVEEISTDPEEKHARKQNGKKDKRNKKGKEVLEELDTTGEPEEISSDPEEKHTKKQNGKKDKRNKKTAGNLEETSSNSAKHVKKEKDKKPKNVEHVEEKKDVNGNVLTDEKSVVRNESEICSEPNEPETCDNV